MGHQRILDVTESPDHVDAVRELFRAYAAEIGIDLGFQGFDEELAELPGCYAAPRGCILLAMDGERTVGCVALRPLEEGVCELKRMYVRPEYRGQKLAGALANEVITRAAALGYTLMRLDTLAAMTAARRLYEGFGFRVTEPYYNNPLPDVVYYELRLNHELHEPGNN